MSEEETTSEGTRPERMAPGDEAPPGAESAGENICPTCGGSGRRDKGRRCPDCGGTGRLDEGESCPNCNGTGVVMKAVGGG